MRKNAFNLHSYHIFNQLVHTPFSDHRFSVAHCTPTIQQTPPPPSFRRAATQQPNESTRCSEHCELNESCTVLVSILRHDDVLLCCGLLFSIHYGQRRPTTRNARSFSVPTSSHNEPYYTAAAVFQRHPPKNATTATTATAFDQSLSSLRVRARFATL